MVSLATFSRGRNVRGWGGRGRGAGGGGLNGPSMQLFWNFLVDKMSFSSDGDEFSDGELYANLPENAFDLAEMTENERRQLDEAIDGWTDDSDGEDLDDDNLPLFFNNPQFQWTRGNYVAPDAEKRVTFSRRCGPVRVFDKSSISALSLFQIFYSDEILSKIVTFTNENQRLKKESDPENHKGKWT